MPPIARSAHDLAVICGWLREHCRLPQKVTREQLAAVMEIDERGAGDVIFRQGQAASGGSKCYILISGEVGFFRERQEDGGEGGDADEEACSSVRRHQSAGVDLGPGAVFAAVVKRGSIIPNEQAAMHKLAARRASGKALSPTGDSPPADAPEAAPAATQGRPPRDTPHPCRYDNGGGASAEPYGAKRGAKASSDSPAAAAMGPVVDATVERHRATMAAEAKARPTLGAGKRVGTQKWGFGGAGGAAAKYADGVGCFSAAAGAMDEALENSPLVRVLTRKGEIFGERAFRTRAPSLSEHPLAWALRPAERLPHMDMASS